MKAICVVAHPDDCIIFAYAFIYNHPNYDWDIAYVTNEQESPRGLEIKKFWNKRGIRTLFLGFEDKVEDHFINHRISFDTDQANAKIQSLVKDYDLILTHNTNGEYGHIHHKFINKCLNKFKNVVTFNYERSFYKFKMLDYKFPANSYDLAEVPLHADVIAKFHKPNIFGNVYCDYNSPRNFKLFFKILMNKFFPDSTDNKL